jgi:predicted MFS family arabinose efflux permease
VVEFSWAGSALVGIPLVGLLIARLGWRSPFIVLGGLALLSVVVLAYLIPRDDRRSLDAKNTLALGALGFSLLIAAANDNLFVIYGAWLESSFGLSVLALGAATMVIGLAELLGEGLTASFADRLGLKRALFTGLVLTASSFILLPFMGRTLPLALAGLFVTFLTFEFTVVTGISLFTEVLPGARATMMSSNVAAMSVGRMIGALIGGAIWLAGGLLAISLVSAAICGLALVCLAWGLRHWRA